MSQDYPQHSEAAAGANPYAPPTASVRDVSGPVEHMTLAGRGGRFVANFLDGLFFLGMVYIPLIVGTALAGPDNEAQAELPTGALVSLLVALVGFVVFCWLNIRNMRRTSQSLGKKIVGIKVVRSDGAHASLGVLIWKRNVLNLLLSIIPLYGIVDALFIFGDSRQCLHDKLADTKVIEA
jgi:uncharacterized RDD family membrane protein YckC